LNRPDSPDPFYKKYGFIPEALGVWLTSSPDTVAQREWATSSRPDKLGVKLTVEVEGADLIIWRDLANQLKISRQAYQCLDKIGGYQAR